MRTPTATGNEIPAKRTQRFPTPMRAAFQMAMKWSAARILSIPAMTKKRSWIRLLAKSQDFSVADVRLAVPRVVQLCYGSAWRCAPWCVVDGDAKARRWQHGAVMRPWLLQ